MVLRRYCDDIDECEENTDDCDELADCVNTEGSFECACTAVAYRDPETGRCVPYGTCSYMFVG